MPSCLHKPNLTFSRLRIDFISLVTLQASMSFLLLILLLTSDHIWAFEESFTIDHDVVRNMVRTFGRELSSAGTEQTCLGRIEENFQAYSQDVSWFDGNKMLDDMRTDVENMLNWKQLALTRIALESERLASNHTFDKNIDNIQYQTVKNFTRPDEMLDTRYGRIERDPNFDNAQVNMDYSAIHVPVNVYEKSPDIINDIKWSEALTPSFKNNLAFDPSLSWQFFGSAKGFLRLYPATPWREPANYTQRPQPDFYDCRMRPWYIQGAASPKDIVILLDTSGSMTGVRKSIAQSVVEHILDTLTDDDYVGVYTFAKTVQPLLKCFATLVQANKRNILEIKEALNSVTTSQLVNFSAPLIEAFNQLQNFYRAKRGSQCNQAIMLITDGAPGTYEDVFKRYNWPNIPVRVFTYLIGHDSTAHNEVYWMACHNRGYYTHVSNLAEVHEQVQKYIPVMSRPIVLSGERIFSWTPLYAPMSEIVLDNLVWKDKQSHDIITKLKNAAEAQGYTQTKDDADIVSARSDDEAALRRVRRQIDNGASSGMGHKEATAQNSPLSLDAHPPLAAPIQAGPYWPSKAFDAKVPNKDVNLFTTLSTPVFDTRNYTNITRRILIKNVYQDSEPESIRIANLLGVAGIDVPIKEIIKLTPAFKLGVNAYVFIITNNGYILYHPDLRPWFEDFLKPFYNSVDISEVELANTTAGPRVWDKDIETIRENMVKGTRGWKKIAVKLHIDEMRRVVSRVNHYTHNHIANTSFSLAIALPEPYGTYRLTSQVDLRMKHRMENFTNYFRGNQWRVHPEWEYCTTPKHRSVGGQSIQMQSFSTPEETIVHFLSNNLENENFRWRTSSTRPSVADTLSCDKDLIQSLVLDAKLTDIPANKCNSNPNLQDEQRMKTFGIVNSFVATRSGLTRFQEYRPDSEIRQPFYEEHTRAIEETFYKRAVDFYAVNRDAFVYSVDFDAGLHYGDRRSANVDFLVTATHALFIGSGKQSTPVAVVGVQMRYSVVHEFFLNTTDKFNVPCTHLDVDCYLVDNNGFVLLSSRQVSDVGRFFGLLEGAIFEELINAGVYRRVKMYDYQAICLEPDEDSSAPASRPFMFSVLRQLSQIGTNIVNLLVTIYMHLLHGHYWPLDATSITNNEPTFQHARQDMIDTGPPSAMPRVIGYEKNRTRIRSCDTEFDLFEMKDFSNFTHRQEYQCSASSPTCTRKFTAQYVPHTNLLLVLVENNPGCSCEKKIISVEPKEVIYPEEERCQQMLAGKSRKRPNACHNYHPQEKDIRQCGGAAAPILTNDKMIQITVILVVNTFWMISMQLF